MSLSDKAPDVDRLARAMLLLHGDHAHAGSPTPRKTSGSCLKAKDFADDPQRAAALAEVSRAERERYLTAGLQPVECRFCHITVAVKKLGPDHTAVQWSTEASQRCAHFVEVRASGGETARIRACPKLTDSIEHAVAEGVVDHPRQG